ncbi:MAG: tRNA (adenosine(37)-N6)-threonylcarbamoyltransferase complex transferase subunit TsaD [Treponema sp.]|jgi:N6-L-threonylcarbamoyladenine synthase|nr:tRNA (adenosine(37)-N6)-threonylcarbamoyltransferase complex transferase subunit TsaD [Treponema sp.]
MIVLGIETSCDECAAALVENGNHILSNVVATQIPFHRAYNGVVPELASRTHTTWIDSVVQAAFDQASVSAVDGVAATVQPGLLGSLIVGSSFAKAFAWAKHIPFIGVDHILAHLYTVHFCTEVINYPFLGLLVSGGHTIICRVDSFDSITVLGTTIDDAVGESFDKVAKHYGFGYPGGVAIDALAREGDPNAFHFPLPRLYKGEHRYDLSYSGLKTAVINQSEQFRVKDRTTPADIAASFQKTAIDMLIAPLLRAVEDTKLSTVGIGGGVAANSLLRERLALLHLKDVRCIIPPAELCGDNGAMVAGLGYHYILNGIYSPLTTVVSARVQAFKKKYP